MRKYCKPFIISQRSLETSALACGKTTDPPPGSFHFSSSYDSLTGHFGPGFGGSESVSGSAGTGWPHGGSTSYPYSALCTNWVTFSS